MIKDEMDLVRQLKDVPPLRPEAYGRARATLGRAMVDTGPRNTGGGSPGRGCSS